MRIHLAGRIIKARERHPEYITFIAFPLQKSFRECTSMLRLYLNGADFEQNTHEPIL
jgi:hypothetical protein